MKTNFHIHSSMMDILCSLLPSRLYRKDLIRIAKTLPHYSSGDQAEKFIGRQVFRLTQHKMMEAHGSRKARWYQPVPELIELLSSQNKNELDQQVNLSEEKLRIEAELALLLAELEEFKLLSKKYPSYEGQIDQLVSNEKSKMTSLYGKLSAIKKLLIAVASKDDQTC